MSSQQLQRTREWWHARRGKITSSRVARVVNGTRDRGWKTLAAELAAEMTMDEMPEWRGTASMERGEDLEPATLANVALDCGFRPILVGFKQHPTIPYLGASSDFLVRIGRSKRFINGEGKAPEKLERHMRIVMNRQLPEEYRPQVQLQMEVHRADLTYFISYHPDAPEWRMRSVKIEVARDQRYIDYMLARCAAFHDFYTFNEPERSDEIPETF